MICKLCKGYFLEEDSIFGIFLFSDICDHCKNTYKPENLFEVIPTNKGTIEYHYLFDNMKLSIRQRDYLSKYLSSFYKLMNKQVPEYDLFIFLDDDIYYQENFFTCLLSDYQHIFLFSLERKELMYKDIF